MLKVTCSLSSPFCLALPGVRRVLAVGRSAAGDVVHPQRVPVALWLGVRLREVAVGLGSGPSTVAPGSAEAWRKLAYSEKEKKPPGPGGKSWWLCNQAQPL